MTLPGPAAPIGALLAVAAVASQLLEAGFDVLPDDALAGWVTLGRLLIAAGLAGVVLAGARLPDFRTGIDVALGLLLIAAVATTVRGGWDAAPLRALVTLIATYYLVVATLRVVPESRAALALLALVSAAAAGAVGVAQVAQGDFTGFYRDGLEPITSTIERPDLQVRAVGTFANPNLLAAFIALTVPVGLLAALRMEDRGLRWGVGALAVIAWAGLLLSYSRAAVLAVLAGAVLAVVLMPQLRAARRPALIAAGAVVAVIAIAAVATGGRALGGFGRPEAWGLALDAAAQDRLTGVGLGRVGDVMNALGDGDETFAHAHDLWLNWLAEAGPLAFLAIAFVTFWLVAEGIRLTRRGDPAPAAAFAALVAFLLMSVVDHPANSLRISIAFWIVAAALAADATRRITPGLFSGEPDEEDREEGVLAGPPARTALEDPVPPRAGPASGEGVRIIRPAAAAAAEGASPEEPAAPGTPADETPLQQPLAEDLAAPDAEEPAEPAPDDDQVTGEHPVVAEGPGADEPAEAPVTAQAPAGEPEPAREPVEAGDGTPDAPRDGHGTAVFPVAEPDAPGRPIPGATEPMEMPFEPLPPLPAAPGGIGDVAGDRPTAGPVPLSGVEDPGALFAMIGAGLAASRDVERTSMMGGPALRVGRRYVAALVDDEALAVRLTAARSRALIDAGDGVAFAPAGRAMEGWVLLPGVDERSWRDLVDEAVAAAESHEAAD